RVRRDGAIEQTGRARPGIEDDRHQRTRSTRTTRPATPTAHTGARSAPGSATGWRRSAAQSGAGVAGAFADAAFPGVPGGGVPGPAGRTAARSFGSNVTHPADGVGGGA